MTIAWIKQAIDFFEKIENHALESDQDSLRQAYQNFLTISHTTGPIECTQFFRRLIDDVIDKAECREEWECLRQNIPSELLTSYSENIFNLVAQLKSDHFRQLLQVESLARINHCGEQPASYIHLLIRLQTEILYPRLAEKFYQTISLKREILDQDQQHVCVLHAIDTYLNSQEAGTFSQFLPYSQMGIVSRVFMELDERQGNAFIEFAKKFPLIQLDQDLWPMKSLEQVTLTFDLLAALNPGSIQALNQLAPEQILCLQQLTEYLHSLSSLLERAMNQATGSIRTRLITGTWALQDYKKCLLNTTLSAFLLQDTSSILLTLKDFTQDFYLSLFSLSSPTKRPGHFFSQTMTAERALKQVHHKLQQKIQGLHDWLQESIQPVSQAFPIER